MNLPREAKLFLKLAVRIWANTVATLQVYHRRSVVIKLSFRNSWNLSSSQASNLLAVFRIESLAQCMNIYCTYYVLYSNFQMNIWADIFKINIKCLNLCGTGSFQNCRNWKRMSKQSHARIYLLHVIQKIFFLQKSSNLSL